MKIIECRGSRKQIGESAGEALREEIQLHIEKFLDKNLFMDAENIKCFTASTERHLPHLMDEMKGLAGGANVSEDYIFALNLPGGQAVKDENLQECSNIVFSEGPDGPLWGKNNDGALPERPVCALKIYPDKGIPLINLTFCGFLATGDMLNAEGVASGHSSVGSKFSQNPRNVSARLWMYDGMFKSRTTEDYARHLTDAPLFGKGFSQVTIDKHGRMCSAEIACPIVQLRWPPEREKAVNCVNCYQLPLLENLTNRKKDPLANALGRKRFFEKSALEGDRSLDHMKTILRHHGAYSICRHGSKDLSNTTYSMIGIPAEGKVFFRTGFACGGGYDEISI